MRLQILSVGFGLNVSELDVMTYQLFSRKTGIMLCVAAMTAGCTGLVSVPFFGKDAANDELKDQVSPTLQEEANSTATNRPAPKLASPTKSTALSSLNQSPLDSELVQSAESPSKDSWLVRPGLFQIDNGLLLNIVALALAVPALFLSLLLYSVIQGLDRDYEILKSRVDKYAARSRDSNAPDILQDAKYAELETSLRLLKSEVEALKSMAKQSSSLLSSQPYYAVESPADNTQGSLSNQASYQPPPFPAPLQLSPSPAQVMADLTAAINRGDRQSLKGEIRAQLNITRESDSAILMSKVDNTQLEVVTAGGSYFMVSIGGDNWLYPTELTLRGYAAEQPSKGIFNYTRQQISQPQVIMPARLSQNGAVWSIVEMGNIGVPA